MTPRKGTPSPIKKQSRGVKKEKSFILKNLEKMSHRQSINKCQKVSAARPQTYRETIEKPFEQNASSVAKNLCNNC